MQKFTPYEYLLISMANANGMDKLTWDERLSWSDNFVKLSFKDQLAFAKEECTDESVLLAKAINAHNEILKGNNVGFMCNLDATASGIQIMSAVTGCKDSAIKVNLIDNNKRNDIYFDISNDMNVIHGCNTTRDMLKKPIMTAFYNSTKQPELLFGKGTSELEAFNKCLQVGLKGAYRLLLDIQTLQDSEALDYTWTLPDGHTAYVPVMGKVDKKVEIAELNKATFTFRTSEQMAKEFDLSLPANVVHSLDAYIVRQLYRRAHVRGYEMTTIHDSFWASPNHIEDIRIGYADELAKLAESNVIQNILNQIAGTNGVFNKYSQDLAQSIRESNYSLS